MASRSRIETRAGVGCNPHQSPNSETGRGSLNLPLVLQPSGMYSDSRRGAARCVTVDSVARVALIGSHSLVLLEDCEKLSRSLTCGSAPVGRRRKQWHAGGGESGKRLAHFVAPVVIIIVVTAIFLAVIHTSIDESSSIRSSGQAASWTGSNEQFQCLRAAFQKEVPRGSNVWVGPESYNRIYSGPWLNGSEQMLAEMATCGPSQPHDLRARWAASITSGNECPGLSLHVEPLR